MKFFLLCLIKYERLPDFCYRCGCIGHSHCECFELGSSTAANGLFSYGDWLRVAPFRRMRLNGSGEDGQGLDSHRGREHGGLGRGRRRGRGRMGLYKTSEDLGSDLVQTFMVALVVNSLPSATTIPPLDKGKTMVGEVSSTLVKEDGSSSGKKGWKRWAKGTLKDVTNVIFVPSSPKHNCLVEMDALPTNEGEAKQLKLMEMDDMLNVFVDHNLAVSGCQPCRGL